MTTREERLENRRIALQTAVQAAALTKTTHIDVTRVADYIVKNAQAFEAFLNGATNANNA